MKDISKVINQTMTTPQIAKLCNKQHPKVMVVADRLKSKGIITAIRIGEQYKKGNDAIGTRDIYQLTKTESINLVANLSPEFTAAIIDRWQELEQSPRSTLPPFRQRAMLNRPNITDGYFSIIEQFDDKIVSALEYLNAPIPKVFYIDISGGKLWSAYLKQSGRSPESVGAIKYQHQFTDGRKPQLAYQYPNILYDEFHAWLRSKWMVDNMAKYLDSKSNELMEYAYEGVDKHLMPKPPRQLAKPVKQVVLF